MELDSVKSADINSVSLTMSTPTHMELDSVESADINKKLTNGCVCDDYTENAQEEFAEIDRKLAPPEENGCTSNISDNVHSENGDHDANTLCVEDDGLEQDDASTISIQLESALGRGLCEASNGANVPDRLGQDGAFTIVDDTFGKNGASCEATSPCITNEVNNSGWILADGALGLVPTSALEKPWLSSKRHTFYLVRIPRIVDEKLKNDISSAEAKLDQAVKKRDAFRPAVLDKKAIKAEMLERLKPIRDKERACRDALQGKRMEIQQFSQVQKKPKNANGMEICNSETELNEKIAVIEYRIQHETIPLKEEKQLLREIKLLESTRSDVCANSATSTELMKDVVPGELIHNHAEFLRKDMESLKRDHKQARLELDTIETEMRKVNEIIEDLNQQSQQANILQQDAYATMRELKKKENLQNDAFYQNRRDIQGARELAAQKNLEKLEEFCIKRVEDFMDIWNNDAMFRCKYVRSNERSTIRWLETLDGRSLGPGEKSPQISEVEIVPPKCEDVKPEPAATNGHANVAKVKPNGVLDKESMHGNAMPVCRKEEGSHSGSTNGKCNVTQTDAVENIVDHEVRDAELKEKHRQEQIAKAKVAEERKRRRAEKSELRAQARAKKDAERKEKERQKRAEKKAAASLSACTSLSPAEGGALSKSLSATESESTPALVLECNSHNGIKPMSESQRVSGVSRRKPFGQQALKGPRPLPHRASLKKLAWPIPVWVCALIALVLVLALILLLRWQGTF